MLIGLTGPSGSHKTVAAKRLQKKWGFNRIHAGQPIKDAVQKMGGLRPDQVRGKAKDHPTPVLGGKTPRNVLEAVGVATHTASPKLTSIQLYRQLLKSARTGKSTVVDGIRSPHEEDVVRKMGGTMVRMDHGKGSDPNLPMDRRQEEVRADSRIDSSGSKGDIQNNVDQLVMKHLGVDFDPKARAGVGPE